jgi:hypothetical protein
MFKFFVKLAGKDATITKKEYEYGTYTTVKIFDRRYTYNVKSGTIYQIFSEDYHHPINFDDLCVLAMYFDIKELRALI